MSLSVSAGTVTLIAKNNYAINQSESEVSDTQTEALLWFQLVTSRDNRQGSTSPKKIITDAFIISYMSNNYFQNYIHIY